MTCNAASLFFSLLLHLLLLIQNTYTITILPLIKQKINTLCTQQQYNDAYTYYFKYNTFRIPQQSKATMTVWFRLDDIQLNPARRSTIYYMNRQGIILNSQKDLYLFTDTSASYLGFGVEDQGEQSLVNSADYGNGLVASGQWYFHAGSVDYANKIVISLVWSASQSQIILYKEIQFPLTSKSFLPTFDRQTELTVWFGNHKLEQDDYTMCGSLFGAWWFTDFLITDIDNLEILYSGSQSSLIFYYDFQFTHVNSSQRVVDSSGNHADAFLGLKSQFDQYDPVIDSNKGVISFCHASLITLPPQLLSSEEYPATFTLSLWIYIGNSLPEFVLYQRLSQQKELFRVNIVPAGAVGQHKFYNTKICVLTNNCLSISSTQINPGLIEAMTWTFVVIGLKSPYESHKQLVDLIVIRDDLTLQLINQLISDTVIYQESLGDQHFIGSQLNQGISDCFEIHDFSVSSGAHLLFNNDAALFIPNCKILMNRYNPICIICQKDYAVYDNRKQCILQSSCSSPQRIFFAETKFCYDKCNSKCQTCLPDDPHYCLSCSNSRQQNPPFCDCFPGYFSNEFQDYCQANIVHPEVQIDKYLITRQSLVNNDSNTLQLPIILPIQFTKSFNSVPQVIFSIIKMDPGLDTVHPQETEDLQQELGVVLNVNNIKETSFNLVIEKWAGSVEEVGILYFATTDHVGFQTGQTNQSTFKIPKLHKFFSAQPGVLYIFVNSFILYQPTNSSQCLNSWNYFRQQGNDTNTLNLQADQNNFAYISYSWIFMPSSLLAYQPLSKNYSQNLLMDSKLTGERRVFLSDPINQGVNQINYYLGLSVIDLFCGPRLSVSTIQLESGSITHEFKTWGNTFYYENGLNMTVFSIYVQCAYSCMTCSLEGPYSCLKCSANRINLPQCTCPIGTVEQYQARCKSCDIEVSQCVTDDKCSTILLYDKTDNKYNCADAYGGCQAITSGLCKICPDLYYNLGDGNCQKIQGGVPQTGQISSLQIIQLDCYSQQDCLATKCRYGCTKCTSNLVCTACKYGYFLYQTNTDGQVLCVKCPQFDFEEQCVECLLDQQNWQFQRICRYILLHNFTNFEIKIFTKINLNYYLIKRTYNIIPINGSENQQDTAYQVVTQLQNCSLEGCLECSQDSQRNCLKCKMGYALHFNKTCQKCQTFCNQCFFGGYVDGQTINYSNPNLSAAESTVNKYKYYVDENNASSVDYQLRCQECSNSNLILSPDLLNCEECGANCLNCAYIDQQYFSQIQAYTIVKNWNELGYKKICRNCQLSFIIHYTQQYCEEEYQNCAVTAYGIPLYSLTNQIFFKINQELYENFGKFCYLCQQNHALQPSLKQCLPGCNLLNCDVCQVSNTTGALLCLKCQEDYYVMNGQCVFQCKAFISNCLQCHVYYIDQQQKTKIVQCLQCQSIDEQGYTLIPSLSGCLRCPANCVNCYQGNLTYNFTSYLTTQQPRLDTNTRKSLKIEYLNQLVCMQCKDEYQLIPFIQFGQGGAAQQQQQQCQKACDDSCAYCKIPTSGQKEPYCQQCKPFTSAVYGAKQLIIATYMDPRILESMISLSQDGKSCHICPYGCALCTKVPVDDEDPYYFYKARCILCYPSNFNHQVTQIQQLTYNTDLRRCQHCPGNTTEQCDFIMEATLYAICNQGNSFGSGTLDDPLQLNYLSQNNKILDEFILNSNNDLQEQYLTLNQLSLRRVRVNLHIIQPNSSEDSSNNFCNMNGPIVLQSNLLDNIKTLDSYSINLNSFNDKTKLSGQERILFCFNTKFNPIANITVQGFTEFIVNNLDFHFSHIQGDGHCQQDPAVDNNGQQINYNLDEELSQLKSNIKQVINIINCQSVQLENVSFVNDINPYSIKKDLQSNFSGFSLVFINIFSKISLLQVSFINLFITQETSLLNQNVNQSLLQSQSALQQIFEEINQYMLVQLTPFEHLTPQLNLSNIIIKNTYFQKSTFLKLPYVRQKLNLSVLLFFNCTFQDFSSIISMADTLQDPNELYGITNAYDDNFYPSIIINNLTIQNNIFFNNSVAWNLGDVSTITLINASIINNTIFARGTQIEDEQDYTETLIDIAFFKSSGFFMSQITLAENRIKKVVLISYSDQQLDSNTQQQTEKMSNITLSKLKFYSNQILGQTRAILLSASSSEESINQKVFTICEVWVSNNTVPNITQKDHYYFYIKQVDYLTIENVYLQESTEMSFVNIEQSYELTNISNFGCSNQKEVNKDQSPSSTGQCLLIQYIKNELILNNILIENKVTTSSQIEIIAEEDILMDRVLKISVNQMWIANNIMQQENTIQAVSPIFLSGNVKAVISIDNSQIINNSLIQKNHQTLIESCSAISIHFQTANVSFINSVFMNNTSPILYNVLLVNAQVINITNCTFLMGNYLQEFIKAQQALNNYTGNLIIQNKGGFGFLRASHLIRIEHCNFSKSYAEYGGALYIETFRNMSLLIIKCSFNDTNALDIDQQSEGGALYLDVHDGILTQIMITESIFTNLQAGKGGVLLIVTNRYVTLVKIQNSTIQNIKSYQDGAFIILQKSSSELDYENQDSLTLNNISISNISRSGTSQTGIYMIITQNVWNIIITDIHVTDSNSSFALIKNSFFVKIANSKVFQLLSNYYNLLQITSKQIDFSNFTVEGCRLALPSTSSLIGFLYIYSQEIFIVNSSFSKIQCNTCSEGVLHIVGQSIFVEQVEFIENSFRSGGSLYLSNESYQDTTYGVNNITARFLEDKSWTIYQDFNYTVIIKSVLFKSNKADLSCGGLYIYNLNVLLQFVSIIENRAYSGAGLYIQQEDLCNTQLIGCRISENQAQIAGGIYFLGRSPQIDNTSYILNNSAKEFGSNYYSYPTEIVMLEPQDNNSQILNQDNYAQYNAENPLTLQSGSVIKPLRFLLLTQEKQKITSLLGIGEDKLKATLSINSGYQQLALLSGVSTVSFTNQQFMFSEINIQGKINQVLELIVSSPVAQLSVENRDYVYKFNVKLRMCISGEQQIDSSNGFSICRECEEGTYSIRPGDVCKECTTVDGGGNSNTLQCRGNTIKFPQGYWRRNNKSDIIIACKNRPSNCVGNINLTQNNSLQLLQNSLESENSGDSYCLAGHVGALCESCDIYSLKWGQAYSMTGTYDCAICADSDVNNLIIALILLYNMLMTQLSVKGTLFVTQKCIFSYFLVKSGLIIGGNSSQAVNPLAVLIKLLQNYVQLIAVIFSFDLTVPEYFMQFFQISGDPVVKMVYSLDCQLVNMNLNIPIVYLRAFISNLMPLYCSLFFLLIYYLIKKTCKTAEIQHGVVDTIFFYSFLSMHPNVVYQILQTISCRKVGDMLYIQGDVYYECYMEEHYIYYIIFTILLIMWTIIIPSLFFYQLYQNRFNLNRIKIRFKLGYIYNEYKVSAFYWEFVKLYQKTFIYGFLNFFASDVKTKAIFMLFVIIIYGFLTNRIKPYTSHEFNDLDRMNNIVVGISMLLALLSSHNEYVEIIYIAYLLILVINVWYIQYKFRLIIKSFTTKFEDEIDIIKQGLITKCPLLNNFIKISALSTKQVLDLWKKVNKKVRDWLQQKKTNPNLPLFEHEYEYPKYPLKKKAVKIMDKNYDVFKKELVGTRNRQSFIKVGDVISQKEVQKVKKQQLQLPNELSSVSKINSKEFQSQNSDFKAPPDVKDHLHIEMQSYHKQASQFGVNSINKLQDPNQVFNFNEDLQDKGNLQPTQLDYFINSQETKKKKEKKEGIEDEEDEDFNLQDEYQSTRQQQKQIYSNEIMLFSKMDKVKTESMIAQDQINNL